MAGHKVGERRVPTVNSSLTFLLRSGIRIGTIVDIGVLSGTSFLSEAFPGAKHLLFEPVDRFDEAIEAHYRGMDYELQHMAISSSSGTAFQVSVSADDSTIITHSYVTDEKPAVGVRTDQGVVVETKSVRKITLDDYFAGRPVKEGYLVKIDVDGHELPIIQGGPRTLAGADVIIVEAAMHSFLERANAIAKLGFDLLDIVGICYYHQILSQVDLVFVRKEVVARHADLRPWATKAFSFEHWQEFNP